MLSSYLSLELEADISTSMQGFAKGGAGAIIMEATSVVPEGRITPEDAVRSCPQQDSILV
jgi:2,4-dienoyl-CoA reductase-like NADH-dependent reductase (Old Yellow Enzyme family)